MPVVHVLLSLTKFTHKYSGVALKKMQANCWNSYSFCDLENLGGNILYISLIWKPFDD